MTAKRRIGKALSLLGGAILALAVLLLALTAWMLSQGKVPSICGYSLLHIVSGSMEPAIPVDSYVLVRRTPAQELREGDIISFYSADPAIYHLPNTHRIDEVKSDGGAVTFITKGDANTAADEAAVAPDQLIGKVVAQPGFLKTIGGLMRRPLVFLLIVIVPLSAIMVWEMVDIAKLRQQADGEDEGKTDENTDETRD